MLRTDFPYEACHELFAGYPQAARSVNQGGTLRSMVLMLQDGDNAGFFVLSHDPSEGSPSYLLWPWPDGDIMNIGADGSTAVPDVAVDVVTRGVPIPRDGSLLGWTCGNVITALVVIYAEYTTACPEPGWAVMPLEGVSETRWPPFTGQRLFGHWSWADYRAGSIAPLDDLIARTPDTVYWVNAEAILGSACCVVARDINSLERHTLQRGCYVHYEALRSGKPVPPLAVLLADPGKIDLAPRFQDYGHSAGRHECGS